MIQNIQISIVSSMYKSADFLRIFVEESRQSMEAIRCTEYEIILVNDGSPDQSLQTAMELQNEYSTVILVDLSRNFGHHAALLAGIEQANGNWIYLSDCDLEISPKNIPEFYAQIMAHPELDMVYGVQDQRRGNFFNRISGMLFWKVLNWVSEIPVPANMLTERIFNRKIKASLMSMGDHHLFLGGMLHWLGFNTKPIFLKKGQRKGQSTYSTFRRVQLMINAISSFSGKPLLWLFYLGIGLSALSFIGGIVIIIIKLRLGDAIQVGWSSLIVMGIFALGLLSTFLGVMGIYLHKIFQQVQNRPHYIISKVIRK
jgi:putative glycosyltransferase